MPDKTKRPAWFGLKEAAALLFVIALVVAYAMYFTPTQRAVRHRLAEADERSAAAVDERLKPIRALFAKGRRGAPAFAKESLSLGGKWAFVRGIVDDGAHRRYLGEAFARTVFDPDELRDAIEKACRHYADDQEGIEARMLVDLRADLADPSRPPLEMPPHLRSNEAFAGEYKALAGRVAGQTGSDLAVSAGREAVVWIGSEVAARAALQAASEMGVSGTLLAGGAAGSVVSMGMTVVIGFIIDYLLDVVFKMAGYDPEAQIAASVVESLNKMEAALLREGSEGLFTTVRPGSLRAEMLKLHGSNSQRRRDAATLMLKGGVQ